MTRIVVLGSKHTCVRLIHELQAAGSPVAGIVTIDDSDDTRSELLTLVELGARVASPSGAMAVIEELNPDVVLVSGWYRIIPDDMLERFLFIGAHYSKLPTYRGSSPVVWAMINGEPEIGWAVFRFTSGMDEGPVAASGAVPAAGYIGDVLDALDAQAIPALVEAARGVGDGSTVFSPQPNVGTSYAAPRRPSDGQIDWSLSALQLQRFVRAQSRPYPGAYAQHHGVLRVWRATAEHLPHYGIPGQVVRVVDGLPVIACGSGGGLLLEETDRDVRWRIGMRLDD